MAGSFKKLKDHFRRATRVLAPLVFSFMSVSSSKAQRPFYPPPQAVSAIMQKTSTAMIRPTTSVEEKNAKLERKPAKLTRVMWRNVKKHMAEERANPDNARQWNAWLAQFGPLKYASIAQKALAVDGAVDSLIEYKYDQDNYGVPNYWATPLETLSRGSGDCEDFAILKFFTLKALGVPEKNLRLTLVGDQGSEKLDHAILVVNAAEGRENALILNNDSEASVLPWDVWEYKPYFVFNTKMQHAPKEKDLTQFKL